MQRPVIAARDCMAKRAEAERRFGQLKDDLDGIDCGQSILLKINYSYRDIADARRIDKDCRLEPRRRKGSGIATLCNQPEQACRGTRISVFGRGYTGGSEIA